MINPLSAMHVMQTFDCVDTTNLLCEINFETTQSVGIPAAETNHTKQKSCRTMSSYKMPFVDNKMVQTVFNVYALDYMKDKRFSVVTVNVSVREQQIKNINQCQKVCFSADNSPKYKQHVNI